MLDISELRETIAGIDAQVRRDLPAAQTYDDVRRLESAALGKKGTLGALFGTVRQYPPAQRGEVGRVLNEAKARLAALFAERIGQLESTDVRAESARATTFDPTLPGRRRMLGGVHPVTAVQWEIETVFQRLGFTVEAGPEMETEYYNFEALNIPEMHPARDMQDTFWLSNGKLLRTQTSAVQVRAMEKFGPPLRVIAPGRCFRYETVDAAHDNTFHQLEGLMVDHDISIANLIAMMRLLLREVFKRDVRVRLRPGYFPFVEPGFELDMSCLICGGDGCATCRRSGWLEICPCGMVHPNVLRFGGVDPAEYTGFAFGLGLTRLAMMKFGIRDIRVMNSGDVRALLPPARLTGPLVR